jgi:hypothetical protein
MSFAQAAKKLLEDSHTPESIVGGIKDKRAAVKALNDSGFGIEDIFTDLRSLYDESEEEPAVRRQILELTIKVHGLLQGEVQAKEPPLFKFIFYGSEDRIVDMLCPPFVSAGAESTI